MKFVYLFLIVCLVRHLKSDDSLLLIEKGIDEFLLNNTKPDYLQNAIDRIFKIKSKPVRNKSVCGACVIVTNALLKLRKNGSSRNTVLEFGQNLCLWFYVNKKPYCTRYIDVFIDAALYIVDQKPDITAEHICAIRLQEYDCTEPDYDSWSIKIPLQIIENEPVKVSKSLHPEKKSVCHFRYFPTVTKHIPTGFKTCKAIESSHTNEHVVHLTDFHYDPLYEPGANTECNYTMCGQSTNGKAANPKNGAGYWGDYSPADMPLHSIRDVLKQIVKQHPTIDRVYYTGDIISHDEWATSKESNSDSIRKIMRELKNTFQSIPVFPILGNHEAHPCDLFAPTSVKEEKLSTQWLFDLVAEEWASFLPSDTQTTIKKGGYYNVLVKPGFRIIGLNSNLCYTWNLWLIYDQKYLQEQLQWLVDNLADAEKNKELVHILSHVPAGDTTCLRQWNHEYRKIVDRFSNIISGQFNGHSHLDELRIFYSLETPNKVVNVAFVGGSFTSFVGLNPNYRVYNVESSTWRVNDYDQWIYNLKEANKYPDQAPNWYKLYSFKDAYGLDNLELSAYHELLLKMSSNTSWIEQYRRFQVRNSAVRLNKPCGNECLSEQFCSISRVDLEDSPQCREFKRKL